MTNKGLEGVALRPPPVAEKGSKALSEIRSKRKHIYVLRIATVFQTVNLKIKSVDESEGYAPQAVGEVEFLASNNHRHPLQVKSTCNAGAFLFLQFFCLSRS